MSITSFHFFFLLLAILAIYYLLPRRPQNIWLLIVSYAFYATWAWEFSLILLGLTAFNFFLAQKLHSEDRKRSGLLWVAISVNVAALVLFRTADFFLPGLMSLLSGMGLQPAQQSLKIILPIGLAYYTLQNISYLVDVYRKQTTASTDFIDFSLYLAYFPKLLSGPIVRAREFLPKLAQKRLVDNTIFARGFTLILIGLIRKLFIAGLLSSLIFWDAFETPEKYTGPELIGWIFIYGLFLYNDFAGYTSIARGISSLFGIELPPNFKQPFFARSLAEFWNSWHITLSHWLRDYIFFPVSRFLLKHNRDPRKFYNLIVPPILTMLISGLWHSLGWHMLLWGGMHGAYQVGERLLALRGPVVRPDQQPLWRQYFSMGVVFILVTFAWVPFLMEPSLALAYWRGIFDWTYPIIRFRRILLFIPIFLVVLGVDWLERHYQDEFFVLRWPRWTRALLMATTFFVLLFLMQAEQQEPFVYQGF
jgi:alginate O-acetyltransferase complex protein AlgI